MAAKLERQQRRFHEAVAARDDTIRRLSALAARELVRHVPEQLNEEDALAGLRQLAARLQSRLDAEIARRERLEQRLADAAEVGRTRELRLREAEAETAALRRELALLERTGFGEPGRAPPRLPAECVLYVGGRPGCVGQVRALLNAAGGELLVHDGGEHDQLSLLPGLIGRAAHVVFPAECVSHEAARTVKRTCRQLGKPWSPLRSASVASFLATFAA
ncbi:MAG: DUF2325 domain-containing protein [Acetobacteraceae bacterium]|nr:DUF2325 domain-containing protein [Acetobacteraceae bacterium]